MLHLFRRIRFCPVIGLQFSQLHKFELFFICGHSYLHILAPITQALLADAARGQHLERRVFILADKAQAMLKLREKLAILLAKGCCKNIGREDVHALVDEIFDEYRR